MKKITKEILKSCAESLLFEMAESQYEMLEGEFEIIMAQMDLIGQNPEIENYTPMTFPFEVKTDYLREDIAEKPLSLDEIFKNAKDVVDNQIKLPKVVG